MRINQGKAIQKYNLLGNTSFERNLILYKTDKRILTY